MFFDRNVLDSSSVIAWKSEFIVATGRPSWYENKKTHRKQLQIQIEYASQIQLSTKVPGLVAPSAGTPSL